MNSSKLWINPEFKKTILGIMSITVLLIATTVIYQTILWNSLNREIISANLGVIGNLIRRHPELREEIVTAFSKPGGVTEQRLGASAAKQFGYDRHLPLAINPVLNRFYSVSLGVMFLILLAPMLLLFFLVYLIFKNFYQALRQTTEAASRIVDGDFTAKLKEESEGEFAKLGHQFNQMSKRLELTLEQLQREKIYLKNLISDISHQLKTPLSSIKMFNELLLEGAMDERARVGFLEKSSQQIERMEWLIKNLLLLARIDAGTLEFKMINQPLLPALETVVTSLKPKWEEKDINVILENTDDCHVQLPHDREWLEEALSNILKNGIEHTAPGGNIKIQFQSSAVMVKITITDTGRGISETDLPHIFERFYQCRNNAPISGTGIGLTLAKSIIEGMDGMISVSSVLGKGTSFTITFVKSGI
ncbi:MAG TPA: HAMP domain-containing sensor histidine kinase [Bacillota bacterium]|nr:HAMP domain-containing sensor histidine kinase [Bacillota bacterium]